MEWINLVSSVGFPIIACAAMAYYVKYQQDANNKEVEGLRADHKEEVEKMTTALNNNTIAITKLIERLDKT